MAKYIAGEELVELPQETVLGALTHYITFEGHTSFQPINSNWGILAEMEMDKKTSLFQNQFLLPDFRKNTCKIFICIT